MIRCVAMVVLLVSLGACATAQPQPGGMANFGWRTITVKEKDPISGQEKDVTYTYPT